MPTREEMQAHRDAFIARLSSTIHGAAMLGDLDLVRALLDGGVDVNALSRHGDTALHRAVMYGRVDIVRLLLERGADVNAEDGDGRTPLSFANRSRKFREIIDMIEAAPPRDP